MANPDYNDFRRCDCGWRMVLPSNSLKLPNFLTEGWHLATPATPRAPPGARASTSSDRSTAASAASFNPVPLLTAKVVLVGRPAGVASAGRTSPSTSSVWAVSGDAFRHPPTASPVPTKQNAAFLPRVGGNLQQDIWPT